jgi:rod shape-determining protein MreC
MSPQGRPWLPYALLAASLLTLALFEAGLLGPLESALGYVIAPVERTVAGLFRSTDFLFSDGREARELRQELEALRRDYEELRLENIRLREQYVATNEQQRELLNFKSENPIYSIVGADILGGDVIGRDTNPYLRYVIVNVGARDGVAVGMPVVAGGATLVGRVARVTPHLAYVQLVNDPTSKVSALLQGSRVTGLLVGQEDGSLVLTDILPDEEVQENEVVVTSGLGGLLPRGLILGQVESVSYQESALFQEAVLRPAVDYRRLEVVAIVTDFDRPPVEEFEEGE